MPDDPENDTPPPDPTISEDTIIYRIENDEAFNLNHHLLPDCALISQIEPYQKETIVAVTKLNKVLLHNNESSLNIVDKVKCITTVPFADGYHCIAVGTESRIIVYDVYQNSTLFQNEIPDGVNCFATGVLGSREPLVFCGGNCAIWGFDKTGHDAYWTVTGTFFSNLKNIERNSGDAVTTMCLCDVDDDGADELIVGSPDCEIRVFKDDLMRTEFMETDAIVAVVRISNDSFAYGLSNGTLGLYKKNTRMWRIKSKNVINSIIPVPNMDEIFVCVWNNGKIDLRFTASGDHALSDKFETNLATAKAFAIKGDVPKIALISVDGKVHMFVVVKKTGRIDKTQETLRDFGQIKHNLLMELSNFETEDHMKDKEKKDEQRIPANTEVKLMLDVDMDARTLLIRVSVTNNVSIRGVVVFAEGPFEGDSFIKVPEESAKPIEEVSVPLLPSRDMPSDISVRTFVGYPSSEKLFLFEGIQHLPLFARFVLLSGNHKEFFKAESHVEFILKMRMQRLFDWLSETFIIVSETSARADGDSKAVELYFIELAPKRELSITLNYNEDTGKVILYVDCLETAGVIVQSLVNFFGVESLTSVAHFPKEFDEVDSIVSELDDMYGVRDRLATELSTQMSMVKEVVVRAEDAVYMDDIESAKRYYNRLKFADKGMRQAFLLKANNHERLVKSLRRLNKIIEHSSKLRAGEHGRNVISTCRSAILDDNKSIIVKILQFGAVNQ